MAGWLLSHVVTCAICNIWPRSRITTGNYREIQQQKWEKLKQIPCLYLRSEVLEKRRQFLLQTNHLKYYNWNMWTNCWTVKLLFIIKISMFGVTIFTFAYYFFWRTNWRLIVITRYVVRHAIYKNVDFSAQCQLTNGKRLVWFSHGQCWHVRMNKYIIVNISYNNVNLEFKTYL